MLEYLQESVCGFISLKLPTFRLNISNAGLRKECFIEDFLESLRVAILGWLFLKHEIHLQDIFINNCKSCKEVLKV